jgi:hypothetical protein
MFAYGHYIRPKLINNLLRLVQFVVVAQFGAETIHVLVYQTGDPLHLPPWYITVDHKQLI